MADYENGIFSNLPRPKRRPGERDGDELISARAYLSMRNFEAEGPLPPRPHASGKGGPSINQGGAALTPAQAYLARTVGGNEGGNAANITTLINGLVADGVWSKLDALYVLAQQNATDSLLNLVGTSYPLTNTGAIFTQYRGYNNFSTVGCLSSGFNAVTATSPNFTQNSANLGAWALGVVVDPDPIFGNSGGASAGSSNIYNNFTGGLFYTRVNDPLAGSAPSPGTNGLYVGDRSSSASTIPYYNGAAQATVTSTSGAPFNGNFYIGFLPAVAGSTVQQIAEAHIGASLGAAGQLALYNRLRTYMTAVGVP